MSTSQVQINGRHSAGPVQPAACPGLVGCEYYSDYYWLCSGSILACNAWRDSRDGAGAVLTTSTVKLLPYENAEVNLKFFKKYLYVFEMLLHFL